MLTTVLALSVTPVPARSQAAPARVVPGHPSLRGNGLQAFDARWQERQWRDSLWVDASTVREVLSIDEARSRLRFVRTVNAGAWGYDVTVVLDRATLAPISVAREVWDSVPSGVTDQLAAAGYTRRFEYTFNPTGYRVAHTRFDGTQEVQTVDLQEPVFDATAMGLILAGLPLEVGYRVRMPALFIQLHDGSATPYEMTARVVALDGNGGEGGRGLSAYRVEIDWADPVTGQITSAGGADQPGGAYWVAPAPPHGLPHVPRYANSTVDFLLEPPADAGARREAWRGRLAALTNDGSAWITANAQYQNDSQEPDSYTMQFRVLPGGLSGVGCMWPTRAGRALDPVWYFQMAWNPLEGRGLLYQIAPDGTIAIGYQGLEDGLRRTAEQTLVQPDGTRLGVAHDDLVLSADSWTGASLFGEPGAWKPGRSYTWNRIAGRARACDAPGS